MNSTKKKTIITTKPNKTNKTKTQKKNYKNKSNKDIAKPNITTKQPTYTAKAPKK